MKFPTMPKGAVFDMDGLLIDTVPLYIQAMCAASVDIGHPVTHTYVMSLIGLLGQELSARLARDLGPTFPVDTFLATTTIYLNTLFTQGVPLKPGATVLVQHLHRLGMPLAVATSMQRKEAEHHLLQTNLLSCFRHIVGRDDVEQSKPHPDVYLKATTLLNLEPHTCIALEDSFNGVCSAHAAGCMVIMVPDVLTPTAEITSLCIGVARDLFEVRSFVAAA